MEIEIKKLDSLEIDQFIELINLFESVFKMEHFTLPDQIHLQNLLANPDFMVFVAMKDQLVTGGLTAYVLHQYYSKKPLAYIFDLAVTQTLQRKGIGKQLISVFNTHCRQQGFEGVFVQADKVDEYALDFYRSTKPTEEEQVVHFDYSLNP